MHVRREHMAITKLLSSGVSLRKTAENTGVSLSTVLRKLPFLSNLCHQKNLALLAQRKKSSHVQFDELETYEHTKCKPIAVALAVEAKSEIILGLGIASMPAKGPLADIAMRKYGQRPNQRAQSLKRVMEGIKPYLGQSMHLLSDMCPIYTGVVRDTLQMAHPSHESPSLKVTYQQVKGGRSNGRGQGELKNLFFDPLFSLNHVCAMLRGGVSRLIRMTWCTTKKFENLLHHLRIYAYVHNLRKLGKLKDMTMREGNGSQ